MRHFLAATLIALIVIAAATADPRLPTGAIGTSRTRPRLSGRASNTASQPRAARVIARPTITVTNLKALQAEVASVGEEQLAPAAAAASDDAPTAALLRGGDQDVTAAASSAPPAAGSPIAGQFIVVYKPGADVEAATSTSQAAATAAVANAVSSGDLVVAASASPESLVSVASVSEAPAGSEGSAAHAVIKVPAALDPEAVKQALAASPNVAAVVPNIVVRISQQGSSCSAVSHGAGVAAQLVSGMSLTWPGCFGGNLTTGLALFGERCGGLDRFRWTGLFAFHNTTGQLYRNCVTLRSVTPAASAAALFGECGVAPTAFSGIPQAACMETARSTCIAASQLSSATFSLRSRFCGASSLQLQGVPCGPNNALIQWNTLVPGSQCTSVTRNGTANDLKKQGDWLGQCGVPPYQLQGVPTRVCGRVPTGSTPVPSPSPSPSPLPSPPIRPPNEPGALPTMALLGGENATLWNMVRIGALDPATNQVVDAAAALASSGIKVVVIDTGADSSHPDLNIVEFIDMVDSSSSSYYNKDGNGHGTHVAGILAARNSGSGVFGVVPGAPVIAYKVLSAEGTGALSTVWSAYKDVLARLQRGEKIAAVNLSLGASSTDATTRATECDFVRQIAAYGTAVVAAAGNDYGLFLDNTLPAACPDALAVTSLQASGAPSTFSNLAYTNSPAELKARVIAAPGSNIFSTLPGGKHAELSGTSMAAPHVTGGMLRCALAGACKLSASPGVTPAKTANYPLIQAAAQAVPCNTSSPCAPSWGRSAAGEYFGYMLNVRQW